MAILEIYDPADERYTAVEIEEGDLVAVTAWNATRHPNRVRKGVTGFIVQVSYRLAGVADTIDLQIGAFPELDTAVALAYELSELLKFDEIGTLDRIEIEIGTDPDDGTIMYRIEPFYREVSNGN